MLTEFAEELIMSHKYNSDYEHFQQNCLLFLGIEPKISEEEFETASDETLVENFMAEVSGYYSKKMETIRRTVMPLIRKVYENEGERYKFISLPYSDGKKAMNLSVNLEDAVNSEGEAIVTELEKGITLALIDNNWKEHLRAMDELKDASFAAQFEQKDPLVIYKKEAYDLFKEFVSDVNREVTNFLLKGIIPINKEEDVKEAKKPRRSRREKVQTNRTGEEQEGTGSGNAASARKPETVRRKEPKVGRNDP